MKKILFATSNKEVIETAKHVVMKFNKYFDPIFCVDTDESLSLIDYELPELKILDYSSEDIDCNRISLDINADPWLHNGGIIAIAPNPKVAAEIEERKDKNILIVLTVSAFKQNFEHVLNILQNNQQFLFNRGMQECMGAHEKGTFICENDVLDVRLYTSFLVNYLYCTNRISDDVRFGLQSSLVELLTNALEHGNCGISYDEKTQWLDAGGNIVDLINKRLEDPEIAARKITLEYEIQKEVTKFSIKDEGEGFDWRSRLANTDDPGLDVAHGRGMKISNTYVQNMTYNDKGNEVFFEVENLKDFSNNVPGIMIPFAAITYAKHQIVFRQNEPSTDLFFIVSGRYGVYANGKLISVLTPNDMFIGEMAFLLDDRRTATIMSAGEGKLIRIPKGAFMNLMRKNPHYGIFLSKLLAQRVVRQNRRTLELSAQIADLQLNQQ